MGMVRRSTSRKAYPIPSQCLYLSSCIRRWEYRIRTLPLHQLAVSALGDQAALEPGVDLLRTRRFWIVSMQLVVGAALASVALQFICPTFSGNPGSPWLMPSAAPRMILRLMILYARSRSGNAGGVCRFAKHILRIAMLTGQGVLVMVAAILRTTAVSNSLGPSRFLLLLHFFSHSLCITDLFSRIRFSTNKVRRAGEEFSA